MAVSKKLILLHMETISIKNVSTCRMNQKGNRINRQRGMKTASVSENRGSGKPPRGNRPEETAQKETAQPNLPFHGAPMEIVKGISDIFLRYGLRSSSMDDICTHLKISKKTLYSYFSNKDEVVEAVMFYRRSQFRAEEIIKQTQDIPSVQLVLGIAENISGSFKSLWPINIFDMKKYHPAIYEKITQQDNSHIDRCMQFLFRKGWKEGMFRKDIDTEMQTEILNMQISYLADPENWPKLKHPAHIVVLHVFVNFIRSIATPAGIAELEKFIDDNPEKKAKVEASSTEFHPLFRPTDMEEHTF